jgi:hypothetical protein
VAVSLIAVLIQFAEIGTWLEQGDATMEDTRNGQTDITNEHFVLEIGQPSRHAFEM